MSRGICQKVVGARWMSDEMRAKMAKDGYRVKRDWWSIEVCGYKRGHIGRHQGGVYGDPPRWRRVVWALKRKAYPLRKQWHRFNCWRGHHKRLPMSDHSDPCIYCEMDSWVGRNREAADA